MKSDMATIGVDVKSWTALASERGEWRAACRDGVDKIVESCHEPIQEDIV